MKGYLNNGYTTSEIDHYFNKGYIEGVREFIGWAYVNGIDFSFMAKEGKDGLYDTPKRLENIEKKFYEFKRMNRG